MTKKVTILAHNYSFYDLVLLLFLFRFLLFTGSSALNFRFVQSDRVRGLCLQPFSFMVNCSVSSHTQAAALIFRGLVHSKVNLRHELTNDCAQESNVTPTVHSSFHFILGPTHCGSVDSLRMGIWWFDLCLRCLQPISCSIFAAAALSSTGQGHQVRLGHHGIRLGWLGHRDWLVGKNSHKEWSPSLWSNTTDRTQCWKWENRSLKAERGKTTVHTHTIIHTPLLSLSFCVCLSVCLPPPPPPYTHTLK